MLCTIGLNISSTYHPGNGSWISHPLREVGKIIDSKVPLKRGYVSSVEGTWHMQNSYSWNRLPFLHPNSQWRFDSSVDDDRRQEESLEATRSTQISTTTTNDLSSKEQSMVAWVSWGDAYTSPLNSWDDNKAIIMITINSNQDFNWIYSQKTNMVLKNGGCLHFHKKKSLVKIPYHKATTTCVFWIQAIARFGSVIFNHKPNSRGFEQSLRKGWKFACPTSCRNAAGFFWRLRFWRFWRISRVLSDGKRQKKNCDRNVELNNFLMMIMGDDDYGWWWLSVMMIMGDDDDDYYYYHHYGWWWLWVMMSMGGGGGGGDDDEQGDDNEHGWWWWA